MNNAPAWLASGSLFPLLIDEAPHEKTGIIVVVPAFDEPDITELLDSLSRCIHPECSCEVVIIINASMYATSQNLNNNLIAISRIEEWKEKNNDCFFMTYAVNLGQPQIKGWGVGLARKAGMDEAAKRFDSINKNDGIIVCLDADCIVLNNYLITLENELLKRKDRNGCSIYFEHPLSGEKFPQSIFNAVYQYELHLRYYFQALVYSGYPDVFHTVGSAMAVKTMAYIKAGGMNRRQAGEDFYFIQKIVAAGGYFTLNTTTVYPSPRISGRVPFGTGAAVRKFIAEGENELLTYSPLAFRDLRVFFGSVNEMYQCNAAELHKLFIKFPDSVKSFLPVEEWSAKISEIKENTSALSSFRKRFFNWFNMFRIVKYLNFSHKTIFQKIPVNKAAEEILSFRDLDTSYAKNTGLLEYYRMLEKES